MRGGHHRRGGGNDPHRIYRIPGMWLISRCSFLTRPRVKASRPTTGLTQVHRTHPLLSDLAGGCVLAQVASETQQGHNHNHNAGVRCRRSNRRPLACSLHAPNHHPHTRQSGTPPRLITAPSGAGSELSYMQHPGRLHLGGRVGYKKLI